jgi:hypothetical protein
MVWMRSTRYEKHGDQFVSGLLYFATREDTLGVTVKQQGQHHLWWVRRTSTTSIRPFYRTGVQVLHNFYHKTSQIVFIQPTIAVSWHVDRLVSVNVDKILANGFATFSVIANPTLF